MEIVLGSKYEGMFMAAQPIILVCPRRTQSLTSQENSQTRANRDGWRASWKQH